MGVVAAIAAVGSTVVAVTSANNQRKVQEQALADQRIANERTEQRLEAENQRTEQEYNRANRQNVDVESALDASELSTQQGASGTLLTGSMGVDPSELNLSQNTLLGG
tara:strand:+ start:1147 stop:1470 length:324 start_codon:yes stop_codon:yes gene_type:complete